MTSRKPIVALVDDDKIFRYTASRNIASTELTQNILEFENGDDALKFLKLHVSDAQTLPDYIFLDINMPYIDGWMFMADFVTLKEQLPKAISIFMVSSSIDPQDINRAKLLSDIKEYVVKPVTREKFVELLNMAAA